MSEYDRKTEIDIGTETVGVRGRGREQTNKQTHTQSDKDIQPRRRREVTMVIVAGALTIMTKITCFFSLLAFASCHLAKRRSQVRDKDSKRERRRREEK
jgi:hypothetical protein